MSDHVPFWKYLISGTSSGLGSVAAGYPMDTLKVRMQTNAKTYGSPWNCLKETLNKEGIFGLYKGVLSPTYGSALLFALLFTSYGYGKKIVAGTDDVSKMTPKQIFSAGLFAGTIPSLVTTPVDRIKVLLQLQVSHKKYTGVFDCARKIGIRGMYQGFTATCLRDIPGCALYYTTYELVLRNLLKRKNKKRENVTLATTVVSGGLAGTCCWLYMIFPDTIKSRIQAAESGTYIGFIDALKRSIHAEGMGIFFKGLGPILLRAFPANAASFVYGFFLSKHHIELMSTL